MASNVVAISRYQLIRLQVEAAVALWQCRQARPSAALAAWCLSLLVRAAPGLVVVWTSTVAMPWYLPVLQVMLHC
jgi:hypothetical protein